MQSHLINVLILTGIRIRKEHPILTLEPLLDLRGQHRQHCLKLRAEVEKSITEEFFLRDEGYGLHCGCY